MMLEKANLPEISCGDGFSRYLSEINKIPSLTQEKEFMLAKSYLDNEDVQAAHQLVKSHLKLVAKIALQYKNYGLPIVELVAEGNVGLMQAVKKYNPDLGFRLSTYAMWWIKSTIQEYVLRSWSLVKIGTTAAQKKLFFSLRKMKNKITSTNKRPINEDDYQNIATTLGVKLKDVREMNQRLSGYDISLNQPIDSDNEDSKEMIEMIPETRSSQETSLSHKQLFEIKKRLLGEAMKILNEREAKILTARKLNESPSTLDTLSNEYSISKERVRQIENRAFAKIQNYVLEKQSSKEFQHNSVN